MPLSQIPEEILPGCWQDDVKMSALLAPVRPKSVNPKDWEMKYKFWKSLVDSYCIRCGVVSFEVPDLRRVFKKAEVTPSCLEMVVEEMVRCGECKHLEEMLRGDAETWGKWAVDLLVKRPVELGYRMLWKKQSGKNVCYVHMETVKNEAKKLLEACREFHGKVLSFEELLRLNGYGLDRVDDLHVIVHFMVKDGKAQMKRMHNCNNEENLKNIFVKIGDKVKSISDVDIGVYTLEQNEKLLEENVGKLEADVYKMREEAKHHLIKGQRQLAKTVLRKKQQLEKLLNKRIDALNNVQVLLSRVKHAESDGEVLASYNLALSSLKDTFKNANLTEDSATKAMLELGEVLDIHDDIQTALAQPVRDESDVEEELAELLKVDEKPADSHSPESDPHLQDLEKRLKNLDLPDVPIYVKGILSSFCHLQPLLL